jgi:hypothetical protein
MFLAKSPDGERFYKKPLLDPGGVFISVVTAVNKAVLVSETKRPLHSRFRSGATTVVWE